MADDTGAAFPFDLAAVCEDMQKRFGWSQKDLSAAMTQLMPAALMGHKYFSPNVSDFASFFPDPSNIASLYNPMEAFASADGTSGKEDQLFPFFGPEIARKAIADQIAGVTGLQREAIQELMPVAATLAMGQVSRPYLQGPARDLLDSFMRGFARGRPKPVPQPADYFQGYTDAMQSMWSSFLKPLEAAASRTPDDEEGGDLEQVAEDEPEPEIVAPEGKGELETMMTDWMSAGLDFQSGQFNAFETLFEKAARDLGQKSTNKN